MSHRGPGCHHGRLDPEVYRLVARGLRAGYPGGPEVLHGADLQVTGGRRLAILGANGSGKTTLLRCLAGSHRPAAGQVYVDGEAVDHSRKGLRAHRQRVQLVLQDPDAQLFSADVRQDVSFGPMNLGLPVEQVRERVGEALALLGIEHLADRPTHQLSYGERKRAATAGAVAMRPHLLLLDEPTAGLDPRGVDEMLDALGRLEEHGTTVVLSTHEVDAALAWADEAAVVADGTVVQGPVAEVLADRELVARARLRHPWQVQATELLARAGMLAPGVRVRTVQELVSALAAARQGA
ncbi:energy-coupling factor ABC transporter ATP-binding protein [Arsenicicoccus dermatophilus]|uniref:energy-coupling factor ABC transporter ATP-binding protein n=1 Tax=Arsenicicoccus dermatophilus TaxID=1076331 RepID=UPI00391707C3